MSVQECSDLFDVCFYTSDGDEFVPEYAMFTQLLNDVGKIKMSCLQQ